MPNSPLQLQNEGLKQHSRDCDEVPHSAFRTEVSSEKRRSLEALVQGFLGQSGGSGIFLHVLPVHLFPLCLCQLRLGLWAGLCWHWATAGALVSTGNELLPSHLLAHPGLDTGVACLECPLGQVWLSAPASLCRGGFLGEGLNWDLSGVKLSDGCALLG